MEYGGGVKSPCRFSGFTGGNQRRLCLKFLDLVWRRAYKRAVANFPIRIMKTQKILIALVLVLTFNLQFSTAYAQGTAFTYQSQLMDGGSATGD
jgi:hypothetical protein